MNRGGLRFTGSGAAFVRAFEQRAQDELEINPPRAHDADDPHVRRVLEAGRARHVRQQRSTPTAAQPAVAAANLDMELGAVREEIARAGRSAWHHAKQLILQRASLHKATERLRKAAVDALLSLTSTSADREALARTCARRIEAQLAQRGLVGRVGADHGVEVGERG